MPYQRKRRYAKKKRYTKKRSYRKRRRYRRAPRMSYTIGRGIQQADTMFQKLRYSNAIVRTPGASTDSYKFAANSAYDPNVTGGASQPSGFDQYALLYSHYQVMGSKIYIKFINDVTNTVQVMGVVYPSSSVTTLSYIDAASQAYAKRFLLGLATGGRNQANIKAYMSVKKFIGRETASVNYAAAVGSNPSNLLYWQIRASDTAGATNIIYTMLVDITYYIKFWNRTNVQDT